MNDFVLPFFLSLHWMAGVKCAKLKALCELSYFCHEGNLI